MLPLIDPYVTAGLDTFFVLLIIDMLGRIIKSVCAASLLPVGLSRKLGTK
jgi:hypothetical protein